ncbi:CHY zinc finger protein [Arthrobacter sp. SAFR-044]|uniref:CHY zinc finger protein n=1 Tax=Arthrobacter sp. SAFR-044 TaxID=3387278 RepID=UPI003F7BB873
MRIFGETVDDQTRCIHYHTDVDVIAIKFKCCLRYYPCHLCHEEEADHPALTWPRNEWAEPAVLCGVCKSEMSINAYLSTTSCPNCAARLNERCAAHTHFYFQT